MGSHVPLTYLYHWGWVCFVFFGALPYFLAIEGMPQTHDIYISCSSLKISHFSKIPISFHQRMEKQDLSTRGIIATGLLLLPTFSSDKSKEICICVLTHLHTHIYKYT